MRRFLSDVSIIVALASSWPDPLHATDVARLGTVQRQQDSLRVAATWYGETTAVSQPVDGREARYAIRWVHNSSMIREESISGQADTITVLAGGPGQRDTVVVAVWPLLHDGALGPPMRRLQVLPPTPPASSAVSMEIVALTRLSEPPPAGGATMGPSVDTRPGSGTTEADLFLDFNDPSDLGVSCSGGLCPFPNGAYRKHTYEPAGGVNRSGAISSHWRTGMAIGFSPVWITVPMARHFKIRYVVKQSAPANGEGSSRKLMRLRSGPGTMIGTLFFRHGDFVWYWEGFAPNIGFARFGPSQHPDNQWHTYELELDYRNINRMSVTFWFDGRATKTITAASVAGDLIHETDPLIISPFLEMYSCGQAPACSTSINTGDYTVDDFSFTILP